LLLCFFVPSMLWTSFWSQLLGTQKFYKCLVICKRLWHPLWFCWFSWFLVLGTGNNTYGADVSEKLIQLRKTDGGAGLAAYILMQRIFPAVHPSYLVHDGIWSCKETISELGIFSTYLR
jgi:hypothetical protein